MAVTAILPNCLLCALPRRQSVHIKPILLNLIPGNSTWPLIRRPPRPRLPPTA